MCYKLSIYFENNKHEKILYNGISYYSNTKTDYINITNKIVEIEFKRRKDKNLSDLLTNNKNTINEQILKSLYFIYGTEGKLLKIERIEIKKNNELTKTYNKDEINQLFSSIIPKNMCFKKSELEIIFTDYNKAKVLLIPIAFLLFGLNEISEGKKFENYWKSFNSLYNYISDEKKEFDKLCDMRKFIENQESRFIQTLELIDLHDSKKIRSIRIRDLILNNFPTENHTDSFKCFVERYKDFRINEVLKETLVFRKKNLEIAGQYIDVLNNINSKLELKIKNNVDLLCFYILRYLYFLRNKYFHAEKMVPYSNLIKNDEIKELEFLNEILEMFLKELILSSDVYKTID